MIDQGGNDMKTKEEILDQLYISPQDLKILIPALGIDKCRLLIDEIRDEMENKKYYIPPSTKPKLALTKLVRKKMGI